MDLLHSEAGNTAEPYFLAGGASVALSHGIATPIDMVKTKTQSDASLATILPAEATQRIARTRESTRWVLGYGMEGALKFDAYESLNPLFLSLFSSGTAVGTAFDRGRHFHKSKTRYDQDTATTTQPPVQKMPCFGELSLVRFEPSVILGRRI